MSTSGQDAGVTESGGTNWRGQTMSKWILRLAALLLWTSSLCAARAEELREILYVPFEKSPNAVIARGDPVPQQANIVAYEPGVVGMAGVMWWMGRQKRSDGHRE